MKINSILILIISLLLFSIPFIFWNHGYMVGGDDSKLYYLFPYEYLKNFTLNIISDNQLGSLGFYFPQMYISLFALFIFIIKKLLFFVNIQLLMFGLNLSLGFFFFYKILGYWINKKKITDLWIKILGSLMYVLSIFTFSTLWLHQLFALYFVAIFPLCFYFFIEAIKDRNIKIILILAIILTIFSCLLLSLPWGLGLLIGTFPILILIFVQNKHIFIKHSFILGLLIILLNIFWIIHIVNAPLVSHANVPDISSTLNSSSFKSDNENIINGSASSNVLIYPLLNLFHINFLKIYSSPLYPILKWNLYLLPFNLFFILAILIAGILQSVSKNKKYTAIYLSGVFALVLNLYFFTANIGTWGTHFFIILNNYIPGFGMFRTMYDKFALSLAFAFAFIFSISLHIIFENKLFRRWEMAILTVFTIIIIINSKPFIFGDYYKLPLSSTTNTYWTITDFNSDFYHLTSFIEKMNDNGRYLWMPLNIANYVFIQDSLLSNHYYIGVSPLQFLSNKKDFNGKLSFQAKQYTFLINSIKNQKYDEIGIFFQKMNIRYIIVNNNITPDLQNSYLFDKDVYYLQNKGLYKALLGNKIKSFGSRYELYEINPRYKSNIIYLSANKNIVETKSENITVNKTDHYRYEITIHKNIFNQNLTFLDSYHNKWILKPEDIFSHVSNHTVAFNYANQWTLSGKKGSKLVLYFQPYYYSNFTFYISFVTFSSIIIFLYVKHGKK